MLLSVAAQLSQSASQCEPNGVLVAVTGQAHGCLSGATRLCCACHSPSARLVQWEARLSGALGSPSVCVCAALGAVYLSGWLARSAIATTTTPKARTWFSVCVCVLWRKLAENAILPPCFRLLSLSCSLRSPSVSTLSHNAATNTSLWLTPSTSKSSSNLYGNMCVCAVLRCVSFRCCVRPAAVDMSKSVCLSVWQLVCERCERSSREREPASFFRPTSQPVCRGWLTGSFTKLLALARFELPPPERERAAAALSCCCCCWRCW